MATKKNAIAVGVFHDAAHAQEAVRELKQAGFTDDQLGIVSHDTNPATAEKTSGKKKAKEKAAHVGEGAVAGAAAGAGVGALWALGIAAGFLPVIGPVVAGGLLASVVASAAGGAAIAGIVGALVGLGIPEEDAQYYEGEFKAGRTIVTVKANGRYNEAWTILHRHGAYNKQMPATTAPEPAGNVEGGQTVQVHEERLHARKKPVKKGEVRVRKEVVTEQQTLQVPVTREEVVIERRPASGRVKGQDVKVGEEIRIPVSEERVRVEKEDVVKEEVSVRKRRVTGAEQVSGTVRKRKSRSRKKGTSTYAANRKVERGPYASPLLLIAGALFLVL